MYGGHLGDASEIKDWNKSRMKDFGRFINSIKQLSSNPNAIICFTKYFPRFHWSMGILKPILTLLPNK